jgi:hypothetical protein
MNEGKEMVRVSISPHFATSPKKTKIFENLIFVILYMQNTILFRNCLLTRNTNMDIYKGVSNHLGILQEWRL